MDEIEVTVVGNAQGVGFRDYAERGARETNVIGMIENLPDGTVHIIAQGLSDNLQYFIELLNEGPVLARVDDVRVSWRSPSQTFYDFHIRY